MSKKLCIHGHFYQPPREDPWLGRIFLEGSAAPLRHWNERITRESYAPLAWARRLDGQGRIADLMNCYEWISFNVGPTLMLWLEREHPKLLERMLEADRLSLTRWGHGNAIAQVFHHIILPLASERDKEVEIEWALADFRKRFGRESEGIWLSECAADVATLEAVAERNIKFVVLSPHQAKLVRANGEEHEVNAWSLDYGIPYNIKLPSGRELAAFFYHASLAQAVAFEGLLSDGEKFWQRIRAAAEAMPGDGRMLTLATDGETYGHHFTFGEMALAYVLAQGYAGRDSVELTNFGAYLAANSPSAEVVLHEPSSWSCPHGIERWRRNCGCSTGEHPEWNQEWRTPLREALDFMKSRVDKHFYTAGAGIFNDAYAALLDFGTVLVEHNSADAFAKQHIRKGVNERAAWTLLVMQESALSAYASCGWFFDEISRIEPVNAMRFALRSMEMLADAGGPDIVDEVAAILGRALSNIPKEGNGKDIFERRARPSRQDAASLCLFSYLLAYAEGRLPDEGHEVSMDYPNLTVRLTVDSRGEDGQCAGHALISAPGRHEGTEYTWNGRLPHPSCKAFIGFGEAELEAKAKNGGAISLRIGCFLARYLKDSLSLAIMKSELDSRHEELTRAAAQAISILCGYEEAQRTENLVQIWSQFAAYIPLAVYREELPEEAIEQIKVLLEQVLPDFPFQQQARDLLNAEVLQELAGENSADDKIAAGIARVNRAFGHMDWWNAQNAIWVDGRVKPGFSAVARELGFRI